MLNGYSKSFIEKQIKESLKNVENTSNNSNKDKTEEIAELFLLYERGLERKLSALLKTWH